MKSAELGTLHEDVDTMQTSYMQVAVLSRLHEMNLRPWLLIG